MPRPSILLVDDDESFLKEYAQIFRARKYCVWTAHCGKEAKKILKKVHPAIAFLDKKLTDMDGESLIKEFKLRSKETSLVVVTGHASMESTIKSLQEGVVDYMVKPLDPRNVIKRTEDILEARQNKDRRLKKLRHWADLQNRKYRYLFEGGISGAIFIVEASDGTIVDCNSNASILTLYKNKDLIGKDVFSLFSDEDQKKQRGFFKNCEKNGPMTLETEILDCQRSLVPVSMSSVFLKIGRKKYIQVVMRDLRLLIETKNKVKDRELKYQSIAETALEGIYQVDEQGRFVFVNQALADIFGYSVEEMIGKSFMLVIDEKNASQVKEMLSGVLKGEPLKGEFTCRHKTGGAIFVYFSIVPLKKDNKISGFTGILMDITRQRFLEEELRHTAGRLEEAVDIRTRELKKAMEDLERANQKLRTDDILKSEFVANVAHEIKNPLFLVRESIGCIQDGLLGDVGEKVRKSLDVARKEIDRLLRLTANMLDLVKLELGKMPLLKEAFDLKTICDDIVFSFEGELKKKNIAMIVDIQDNSLSVWADKDLIKEVVINLLVNAFKYSPEGGRIILRAYNAGEYARLEVLDQGPGVPEDEREKIFDKFYRIFKDKEEGSGLGLSIAKEIIEAHEGRIWVEAGEGVVSKFVVLLNKGS